MHGYNVALDGATRETMLRLGSVLAMDGSEIALERSAKELMRWCEKSMFGREPLYVIVVEAEGVMNGLPTARRVVVSMVDSFKTTAFIAAETAERALLENPSPGAYWAWKFLDSARIVRDLQEDDRVAAIRMTAFEPGEPPDSEEEGEI
jgi:hypothetical protein